jgi:N utilization substance protein B
MGIRRKARESALRMLYSFDLGKHNIEEVIETYWELYEPEADWQEFSEMLVRGTVDRLDEIDQLVQSVSMHWKISRMGSVDRNILRMAAFELFHVDDVPKRVTLNEAIEIAKRYGTVDSSAFINGILDKIADDVD